MNQLGKRKLLVDHVSVQQKPAATTYSCIANLLLGGRDGAIKKNNFAFPKCLQLGNTSIQTTSIFIFYFNFFDFFVWEI